MNGKAVHFIPQLREPVPRSSFAAPKEGAVGSDVATPKIPSPSGAHALRGHLFVTLGAEKKVPTGIVGTRQYSDAGIYPL